MPEKVSIPLSCYIRTLNEAKRIGPVVRKVIEMGAEVIVVDSGSTDRTREIARDAGAKVIVKAWPGNGFQKRNGEDAATNDWLLDLDADEVLSPELQDEIRSLFENDAPEPGIYALKLITVPPVPRGKVWRHSNVDHRNKLYHRSIVRMPEHAAWDQFKVPEGIKPKKLKGALLHYSFRDVAHQMDKANKGSTVRSLETRLKPRIFLALRILFAFPFYFSKKFFKQGLWRQGIYGFACSAVIASNRWLKDVKMYEIHLAKRGRYSAICCPIRSRTTTKRSGNGVPER